MIPLKKIEDSYARISSYLTPTRLEKSLNLSDDQSSVFMKLENEQPLVKTFKVRGVLSKLTSLTKDDLEQKRLAAISSGNHGAALAYCAQRMGLKSPIIFAPKTAPAPKLEKIRYFGAEVVQVGNIYDETHIEAGQIIEEAGYTLIDSREDETGVAGQGSIGVEILNQLPDVEVVILPMGSGGLAVSTASYFRQKKPSVQVYAVESDKSPSLIENLKTGIWTETFQVTAPGEPLLKSLVGGCAKLTFHNAEVLEDILLISDEEAMNATAEIMRKEKTIVEPDSAVVYAAYQKYRHLFQNKKSVVVFSGGNIDDDVFKTIVSQYY